jgi:NAD dependent epimerase/dehydratase family enzyme
VRRPTFFSVPRWVIAALFGAMGREALLSGARVRPAKLLEHGWKFRSDEIEGALRECCGYD